MCRVLFLLFAPLKRQRGLKCFSITLVHLRFWFFIYLITKKSKIGGNTVKTTYFIWKSQPRNGTSPDWLEINGQEFYALVNSPENKNRYFVMLKGVSENDGTVVIESTKSEYCKWRKEKDHGDYVRECNLKKGYKIFSYHNDVSTNGDCYGEEILADMNCNVEADYFEALELEMLNEALAQLTDNERRMIEHLYLLEEKRTEQEYSSLIGIPQQTINYRKNQILQKLKNFFEN